MRRLWSFVGALPIAFVCTGLPTQTRAADPIPLEAFTRFDEFGGVKISPDGKFLALQMRRDSPTPHLSHTGISLIDLENRKVEKTIEGIPDLEIHDFRWLSPTRLLLMTSQRSSELSAPDATNYALAIERDGRYRQRLYCCTPYTPWGMPAPLRVGGTDLLGIEDARHVVIAEHPTRDEGAARRADPYMKPTVYRLDTYSRNYVDLGVAPLRGALLLLDRDAKVRFALGLDEHSKLAIAWKPDAGAEWTRLFLKELRTGSVVPHRFSSDNRSVFLTGVREGDTLAALYRLDLQTQKLERLHAFESGEVTGVITDFADREVVGVRGYGERPLEHWLQPENPEALTYQALYRAFPQQRVSVTSATSDGRQAIVLVDSDINPGDYYLFDAVSKRAQFLRAARAWIDPKQMRPKEPIALKARDGLQLHGYLTRPAGEGPHPMVVLPHDGPFGVRDTWEFDWEVQLLASRGYAVLQVNYRGSAGYGSDFERAGYGEWGAKVQDDITDATRWAIEQRVTSREQICIYGKEYGGYAAVMAVEREPDLYRCAIGYNGIYDLELAHTDDTGGGGNSVERAFGSERKQLRERSPAFDARGTFNAAPNVRNIKAPVLLICGSDAWYKDSQHASLMKAALERNGKQVESLAVVRHDEQLYNGSSRREVYERILQFLDTNLSARPGI
jgi:dipeptidyl aminopeptidase/acylaminoacyl peptidase